MTSKTYARPVRQAAPPEVRARFQLPLPRSPGKRAIRVAIVNHCTGAHDSDRKLVAVLYFGVLAQLETSGRKP
ncbi:MAG: hypothetical protein ACI83P_001934 [Janthinobacterium sp.]|jgi:hypothetical protein